MRGRPIQSDLQIGINVKPRANNALGPIDWLFAFLSPSWLQRAAGIYTGS